MLSRFFAPRIPRRLPAAKNDGVEISGTRHRCSCKILRDKSNLPAYAPQLLTPHLLYTNF